MTQGCVTDFCKAISTCIMFTYTDHILVIIDFLISTLSIDTHCIYLFINIVEPRLYCGHHWDPSNCLDFRGVLNSGVVLYKIATIGTQESVHI